MELEPDDRQLIPEPDEYYEPYMEWLDRQGEVRNKDDLLARFEQGWKFEEFMEEYCAKV